MQGYTAQTVRTENRIRALRCLIEHQTLTRGMLRDILGLSAPTTGKLVEELVACGVAEEYAGESGERGRPAMHVKLIPDGMLFGGVSLEGRYVRVGVVDLLGDIRAVTRFEVKSGTAMETARLNLAPALLSLLEDNGLPVSRLAGVGIGIPAVYDETSRTVLDAPLTGITQPTPIGPMLDHFSETLRCPVVAGSDVSAAALGEFCRRSCESLIYISLGSDISAGCIYRGAAYLGHNWRAGKIGQFQNKGGRLGTRVNLAALCERYGLSGAEAIMRLPEGSRNAVIHYLVGELAPVLINLDIILDSETVVLGGIVASALGEGFYAELNAAIQRLSPLGLVVTPPLTSDSDVIGSAALCGDRAQCAFLRRKKDCTAKKGAESLQKN